jgi:glycosyltransferase involved in cell wall biosynthesis
MKICFVSSVHPKFDKRVFQKEACMLALSNFDVIHIAPGSDEREYAERGVRIQEYESKSGLLGRVKQAGKLYGISKAQKADFYHANEFDSWLVCLAVRLTHRCKVVFDVHEFYPEMFAARRFHSLLKPLASATIRFCYLLFMTFTYRVVLANRHIMSDIPNVHKHKCVIVENFGHRPSFATDVSRVMVARGPLKIVHVGLLNEERGSIVLLDALQLVKNRNVEVSLIGEITDMSVESYREEIESRGLSAMVRVVAWLPYADLVKEITKAHLGFVFFLGETHTNKYGLPHKLFDYMSNGLAVLSSRHAEYVSEIVMQAKAGWIVDPENAMQLAAFFDTLHDQFEKIGEYGMNGKRAVNDEFNWENEFAKLVEIYK